jgi:hypothetical protein
MEGVQRVMDNYKTTEDRNHANAADIERLLSTPSSGTSPSASTASTSSSAPGQKAL